MVIFPHFRLLCNRQDIWPFAKFRTWAFSMLLLGVILLWRQNCACQQYYGPYDVIMRKSANRCDVGPLAIRQFNDHRKQDFNVICQVRVFRAGRKFKMTVPASDWLRHVRFLLCNTLREFDDTWEAVRLQSPPPNTSFSGWLHSCPLIGRNIFFTSLQPLNGIQRN